MVVGVVAIHGTIAIVTNGLNQTVGGVQILVETSNGVTNSEVPNVLEKRQVIQCFIDGLDTDSCISRHAFPFILCWLGTWLGTWLRARLGSWKKTIIRVDRGNNRGSCWLRT